MWEMLAPLIRWPLYSPARFATVVVVALVAVFVVGGARDDPTGSANASPSAAVTRSTDASATTASAAPQINADADAGATDELSEDPAERDRSAAAADAAAAFVAAWARPDLDAAEWAAGVRPLATEELWSTGLSMTDPSSTPTVTVRGEPRQVAINAEEGVLDVPTTGVWVRVRVVTDDATGAWLVSSVDPVS